MFKKIIEKRRKKKREEQFRDGYDFAAGGLLRKDHTPISVESFFYGSIMDDFDRGIRAAVQDAILQSFVKDDRL